MKAFDINLLGTAYRINPLESGEFEISQGDYVLGVISAKTGDFGITWNGGGINNDLAQQIGELIEEHDM